MTINSKDKAIIEAYATLFGLKYEQVSEFVDSYGLSSLVSNGLMLMNTDVRKSKFEAFTQLVNSYHHLKHDTPSLSRPDLISDYSRQFFTDIHNKESVVVLCLNNKLHPVYCCEIALGTIDTVVISFPDIIKKAIIFNASSLALIHNHPTGDLTPSSEDILTTKKVLEACKLLGIRFHDHIIISPYDLTNYYSFYKSTDLFR